MGLRDELQADIAEAFDDVDGLADAVTAFSCTREVVTGDYDPETGTTPQTTIGYQGRGVFGSYSVQEIDGAKILATDVKLSGVLQNELLAAVNGEPTGERETPLVDDVINGLTVISVGQDPASVTWSMQLRRT
ncbi:glutamate 5-kinase [Vreelandella aquamarina]|uniref:hypothetical protein n=1 Tax=Vreelandella aquamarina TaxID=77097 RepID=UPI00384C1683